MEYPRLLIINSHSFNDYKGGGITLKNLFTGWPKDRFAIAHFDDAPPTPGVCENYYRLGYNECHYIFPLNKLSTEPRQANEGGYTAEGYFKQFPSSGGLISKNSLAGPKGLKKNVLEFIEKTGIRELIHPMRLSVQFEDWLKSYKPEIIYCQSENISFINLVLRAYKATGAKVVVHVMDDWPSQIYKRKSLRSLLRYIVNYKFRKLLSIASLRLGISKAMADEYESRYQLKFKYFHNPIDTHKAELTKSQFKLGEHALLVVYSGRIGVTASHDSIIEFSRCIESLRMEGMEIRFNIYTDLTNSEVDFSYFQRPGTYLLPALKDDNFISKLLEADLLLYPVDFDKNSIEFIRLSFPTKLPSYLISGVPVLCYGPREVFSIRLMEEQKLSFMCTEQNDQVLKSVIIKSLNDKDERLALAKSAYSYAIDNFEITKVRAAFHETIAGCLN
jgi:hypothetical protein